MLEPLASTILSLAIAHAPPGRSPYSMELLPQCGTDRHGPACSRDPPCPLPVYYCRPPRWSEARHGWVRVESEERATRRYRSIAHAIAASATKLHHCLDEQGHPLPSCTPSGWPGSTEALALSMLTVALHESGLREDVQNGVRPLGRGFGGAACLMQIRPASIVNHAPWLSPQEREKIKGDEAAQETLAQSLLGDSKDALQKCFETGGIMLVRARSSCGASSVPWDYGMFSMYGTGSTCANRAVGASRKKTFAQLVAKSSRAHPTQE